ncbi:hypothetical protein TgHK011_000277 [Trichoderma gracile]|nr:hypothetical protein TgHK011_000277 [Trichoderma gracile]
MLKQLCNCSSQMIRSYAMGRGENQRHGVSAALLTSLEQHVVRIEESQMFAVSLALVVAHPQLESSQAGYGLCCALSTTKKALARVLFLGDSKRAEIGRGESMMTGAMDELKVCWVVRWRTGLCTVQKRFEIVRSGFGLTGSRLVPSTECPAPAPACTCACTAAVIKSFKLLPVPVLLVCWVPQ